MYTYDKSGNRTATYEFPNEGAPAGHWLALYPYAGELLAEYEYTNSSWGDLLTNYDGTAITYDSSGNPQNWKDVSHLQWSGDRLMRANFYLMDSTVDFYYNSDGIRIRKDDWREEISHIDHLYTLDGSRIISEQCLAKNGSNEVTDSYTLYYIYDTAGSVIGFEYNGTKYWYDKNLQGDITAIRNASGTLVAQYAYDAWGKHISITDGSGNDVSNNETHIANINPFRYRGYYFDVETGWYYLNARYYDPNVGRFISPDTTDVLTATPMGLTDKNLYAYCDNNPVMREDKGGQFWNIIAGAVIGGVLELAGQLLSGKSLSEVNWAKVGVSAVSGGLTAAVGTVAGCLISGATDVAMDALDGNDNSVADAAKSFAWGTAKAAISYGVGTAVGKATKSLTKVEKVGKIGDGGYPGVKYSYNKGQSRAVRSIELHPNHNNHGIHLQGNKWNPKTGTRSGVFFRKTLWR